MNPQMKQRSQPKRKNLKHRLPVVIRPKSTQDSLCIQACTVYFLLFARFVDEKHDKPISFHNITILHSRISIIQPGDFQIHLPPLAVIEKNLRSNRCAMFFTSHFPSLQPTTQAQTIPQPNSKSEPKTRRKKRRSEPPNTHYYNWHNKLPHPTKHYQTDREKRSESK